MSESRIHWALAEIHRAMSAVLEEDGLIVQDVEAELPGQYATLETAMAGAIRSVQASESMADAVKVRMDALKIRHDRFRARGVRMREVLAGAMEAAGLKRFECADGSLSLRAGSGHVVIVDAEKLPDDMVRIKREPDKPAIGAALKAGQQVPGAELSNSAPSVQLRST